MDAFWVRPALEHMAQCLANAGDVVLLPDLYHRLGHRPPVDVAA